jgi:hypothetical protein
MWQDLCVDRACALIGPVAEKMAFLGILARNFAGKSSGFFYKCEVEIAFLVIFTYLKVATHVLDLRYALTGDVFVLNYLLELSFVRLANCVPTKLLKV